MSKSFKGEVKARIVEARFALSGKVANVAKHTGDTVKKWGLIASLDRKILQTELDAELADYEKVRADFEIFGQKNPNPTEMIDKYLKTEKNAELTGSVKSVELVKARLDQADLFSPVDGIILDDSGIVPGLYVTPANSSIKIIDTGSYYVEVEVEEKEIKNFVEPKDSSVKIGALDLSLKSRTSPIFSDGKKYYTKIPISDSGLLLGLSAEVTFS
jgi:multidrug resistance efflux pump